MHTTPYFHATNLPNVNPKNLVQVSLTEKIPMVLDFRHTSLNNSLFQIGIGGWQVPRPAVPNMISRETNIFTMGDIEKYGIDKISEMALDRAWDGCDAVYMSYDIDSIEAAFVPGTGWPEPGGLLPREALKLVGNVAKEGLCGMEVVEVSPPYDHADITSLMALRIIVDALGAMVSHGTLKKCMGIFDKEFKPF
jgi:agmatinase